MRTMLAEHPLVAHKLALLRDATTDSPAFRRLVEELTTLLTYEATRDLVVEPVTIRTPLASTTARRLALPGPVVIPILRAGLGMLEGMTRMLPMAEIGFLGMVRDEVTLAATTYADRIPMDLSGRQVFLLDPMLATGGTLAMALDLVMARGAQDVTAVCLLAAPEGIAVLESAAAAHERRTTLVVAAIDERLDTNGYIHPGLGDAGDRLYGVV